MKKKRKEKERRKLCTSRDIDAALVLYLCIEWDLAIMGMPTKI